MNDNLRSDSQQPQDRPSAHEVHPDSIAVKRWLRLAMDHRQLLPKQAYLELGVDAGTWSRWNSYEHDQTLPMGLLPRLIDLLGTDALCDLDNVLRRRT